MSIWEALILGIVQGITEFLPISSSGHLVIAEALFGITESNLAFAIILHLGTFLAIVAAYFSSVMNLLKQFFLMLWDLIRFKGLGLNKSKYRRYIVYIIIATIPAGVAGVLFDDYIESAFSSVAFVAMMLFITGILLLLGERVGKKNTLLIEEMGPAKSFVIGLFQMCAIMPGLSRSGTTMTGGLVCGLKKDEALEFSFLLALVAILGSVVLKLGDISDAIKTITLTPIAVGFLSSMVVGYLSIKLFKAIVQKGRLSYFSVYCFIVGALLVFNIGRF